MISIGNIEIWTVRISLTLIAVALCLSPVHSTEKIEESCDCKEEVLVFETNQRSDRQIVSASVWYDPNKSPVSVENSLFDIGYFILPQTKLYLRYQSLKLLD